MTNEPFKCISFMQIVSKTAARAIVNDVKYVITRSERYPKLTDSH
jgi:hypothetical protein